MNDKYVGNPKDEVSIGKLKANIVALISNISLLIGMPGIFIPIITLLLEKKNEFVRFYAKQTLISYITILIGVIVSNKLKVNTNKPDILIIIVNIYILILFLFQFVAAQNSFAGVIYKIPIYKNIIDKI